MPNPFEFDYMIMDEFGEKEIICMACAKTIKSRSEIKTQNGLVRELAKHADYREVPVILSNGSIAFIMVCDDCKFVHIGEVEAALLTKQIFNARRIQLEHKGLTADVIQTILDQFDFPVLRKAENSEVASAMRIS